MYSSSDWIYDHVVGAPLVDAHTPEATFKAGNATVAFAAERGMPGPWIVFSKTIGG